ncbi:hypothetical protein A2W14_01845 [Candidatus Gottesmanbacteria bacterium RBG_16_37_8]|uniref:Uncharacterized protein n=1 Tax=Candidatus Gottesmanbacteria bacterium RBG_16_37_8 TaxID=1798371 RepID=A0A1F5YTW0_9BACT|nr:MAG: hypothetical protein A2W14_01845 [Candidatus Gottesmanbacteria bacterium RBG_16_37_8]
MNQKEFKMKNKIKIIQTVIKPTLEKSLYLIGSDLLGLLPDILKERKITVGGIFLIVDKTVNSLYGQKLRIVLNKISDNLSVSEINPGEKSKNIENLPKIISPFFKTKIFKNLLIVAFGGGVVTDIAGFTASILLRGIRCCLIPTTLLAQTDATIGGKNGMDYPLNGKLLKNMIGTIKQPDLVLTDVDLLKTLSDKEWRNGLAEIVKYALTFNKPVLDNSLIKKMKLKKEQNLINLIYDCQKIKLKIVEKDPFDTLHIREKLNLGHTIGHAIESSHHDKFSHGEAVSLGLASIAFISRKMNLLPERKFDQIIKLLTELGLPTKINKLNFPAVLKSLKFDKKAGTFILMKDFGQLLTGQIVPELLVIKALKQISS